MCYPEEKIKVDLTGRLRRYTMRWGEPSGAPSDWRQGAPVGNGDFGAMIYGSPDNFSLALGKTDLWNLPQPARSCFKGRDFSEVRNIFETGDRRKFAELCDQPEPRKGHATAAGMLRFHFNDQDSCSSTTLSCDISCGIATLSYSPCGILDDIHTWGENRIEALVSREYQVLAIQARCTDLQPGFKMDPGIRRNYPPEAATLGEVNWELSRAKSVYGSAARAEIDGSDALLEQQLEGGLRFVIALRVVHEKNRLFPAGDRIVGTCPTGFSDCLHVYATIVSSLDASDYRQEAKRRLDAAEHAGFRRIRDQHCRWWREFYQRAYLLIDCEEAEKSYFTSLYITGSILSPDHQSPGLQGCWHKEQVPAWLSDYHTNVNLQALYWGVFANNRLELAQPLLNLIKRISVQARRDTREYFHMRGLRLPHAGSADGHELTTGDWAVLLGCSVGGSGWIADLLWQIYEYSGNREQLRDEIYPLLKSIAEFYADYIQRDGEGHLELSPSVFFEAQCPRFEAWGRNSLYELVTVRLGLQAALKAAETLSVDSGEREIWADILAELPAFPCDDHHEWIAYPDRDLRLSGSHQYALPPVFPGNFVSKWHGPEELRKQAFATLASRHTSSSLTGKAWCGGQGLREIIRMGKAEQALDEIRFTTTNSLTYRWDAGYFQVDHSPGMCSVLPDMMLLRTGDVIRLFADFPRQVNAAFSRLLAPGAFEISSEFRDGSVPYILVRSLCGNTLKLANPWFQDAEEWEVVCEGAVIRSGFEREIEVETFSGRMYIIQRAAYPYKSVTEKTY